MTARVYIKINDTSDNLDLVRGLCSKDWLIRYKSRKALVNNRQHARKELYDLLAHPKHICRWEAVKTLEEMALPESIPHLISALEDEHCDVRWVAARGLVRIGCRSVMPLLRALILNIDSVHLMEGAHHVFHDLRDCSKLPESFPVDLVLRQLEHSDLKGGAKHFYYSLVKEYASQQKYH